MKTLRGFQYAYTLLLTIAVVTSSVALESKQSTDDTSLNVIATNAFHVLKDVPSVGLEKSLSGLEQIIETHHRLSREADMSQRQLSLALADAVAYAIVTEIHRADVARLGSDFGMTPKSISCDKKTVLRLWKANMPDYAAVIRQALRGNDTVTGFVSTRASEESVLNGEMIDKAPLDTIRPRIRELHEKALLPAAFGKNPSADEQLVYALAKFQAFRDLDLIINLYEKGDLPNESAALRTAIDGLLNKAVGRRVDDGMEQSSFKVWMTFRRYHPEGTSQDPIGPIEEYYLKQALALAPFMNDTRLLPESAKKALVKMGQPAASQQTK